MNYKFTLCLIRSQSKACDVWLSFHVKTNLSWNQLEYAMTPWYTATGTHVAEGNEKRFWPRQGVIGY